MARDAIRLRGRARRASLHPGVERAAREQPERLGADAVWHACVGMLCMTSHGRAGEGRGVLLSIAPGYCRLPSLRLPFIL